MGNTAPLPSDPMERAKLLMERKDNIQAELETHYSILKSHDCTMSTPLLDSKGFPRGDIDIYAIRLSRVRIIELQNDMTKVMDDIKAALESLHSQQADDEDEPTASGDEDAKPFARVDGVMPGSPASQAVSFVLRAQLSGFSSSDIVAMSRVYKGRTSFCSSEI